MKKHALLSSNLVRPLVDTVDYSIQTAGYFIETPVQDTPGSEKDKKTFMFSNLFIF